MKSNVIHKSPSGRWVLNGVELSSGSHFQVFIQGYWINTEIEHNGHDYYAIPLAVRLYPGLRARFSGKYSD